MERQLIDFNDSQQLHKDKTIERIVFEVVKLIFNHNVVVVDDEIREQYISNLCVIFIAAFCHKFFPLCQQI